MRNAIYSFPGAALLISVIDWSGLPPPGLASYGDHSPIAPVALSLRPLIPKVFLIRCEPVQVYHHHLYSRVLRSMI